MIKAAILFENEDLIIVNKPAGMLVIPDRLQQDPISLKRILEYQTKQKIFVIHRLDRDTSGVVCFAKNATAHRTYSMHFEAHEVEKYYAAIVQGIVEPSARKIENYITEHPAIKGKMIIAKKGKLALTEFKVVQQWPLHALLKIQLHTGRTHQIRVHLQSIGHPLVCDQIYGDGKPFLLSEIKKKFKMNKNDIEEKPLLNRFALHAEQLILPNANGAKINITAPFPKDMNACINQLNKIYSK